MATRCWCSGTAAQRADVQLDLRVRVYVRVDVWRCHCVAFRNGGHQGHEARGLEMWESFDDSCCFSSNWSMPCVPIHL
eukprot:360973-Chlamydomonas_euryale.AAC.4